VTVVETRSFTTKTRRGIGEERAKAEAIQEVVQWAAEKWSSGQVV
jgi:hypothetical protein